METYREPLRTLIGRYESQFLRERHAAKTSCYYAQSLWNFFSHFPRKSSPEQFALADAEDYRVWRAEEGAPYSVIRKELCVVKAFFSWLINETSGYEELANPILIPPWPERRAA